MLALFGGTVRFLAHTEGGRSSGPPSGPTYAATAAIHPGHRRSVRVNPALTGPHFSVVLEFVHAPVVGEWSQVTVRPLVEGAPGSEALAAGACLAILEGRREVALLDVEFEIEPGEPSV